MFYIFWLYDGNNSYNIKTANIIKKKFVDNGDMHDPHTNDRVCRLSCCINGVVSIYKIRDILIL